MQTALTQRTFVAGTAVRSAGPSVQRCSRSAMVVRAEAGETRRAVLTGVLAGALALGAAKAQAMELIDDRKVKDTGYDIIYEARELDLPQSTRDGFDQARANLQDTKARIKEAERRIDSTLPGLIQKEYWTKAREELRGQVGTLRFDLNVLAEQKPKAEKKQAQALKKKFLQEAEAFDFAIRKKSPGSAAAGLEATKASLDEVLAFVM